MIDQPRGRIVSKRDVLFVVFKRLKMIIAIFLFTMATVIVGILLSKPVYQSSAKVIINRNISEAVLRIAPWTPISRRFELEEEINSEIELIKSRKVVEAVIDQLDQMFEEPEPSAVPDDSEAEEGGLEQERLDKILALQAAIESNPVKKSDVIQITYSSTDPQKAMIVANMVAEAYIEYRARIYRSTGAVDFYDEQIESAKLNLNQLESALKEYREQEAMLSYDRQELILLTKLSNFETALTEVRKDIISIESRLPKMRQYMASPAQPLMPSVEIRAEPVISDMHDRLIELRLQLNEFLAKYTEDHQLVRNLRSELAMGESELRIEVEKLIDLQESSLAVLRAEEGALRSTVNMLYSEVKTLPEKELTIAQLQRAIENHQDVYSMLVLKREETRVSEASDRRIANVSVISPATLPIRPVKPQKGLLLFAGFIIGLIGGFGLAFVTEFMDHSLRTAEDVEHYLDLPVLACIPETK